MVCVCRPAFVAVVCLGFVAVRLAHVRLLVLLALSPVQLVAAIVGFHVEAEFLDGLAQELPAVALALALNCLTRVEIPVELVAAISGGHLQALEGGEKLRVLPNPQL